MTRTIAEATIDTFTAFLENSQFELRHAEPSKEAHWKRRIVAYQAVIDAVEAVREVEKDA